MSNIKGFTLLGKARFGPFFLSQFLGAFNDNLFKNALIIMIAFQSVAIGPFSAGVLINIAAGVFVLPFFLFSALAGQIAEKYEKSHLIRIIKFVEIMIVLFAIFALFFHYYALMLFVLFALGVQSAFFSPIKYSIVPQHLKTSELIAGNAMLEMGTFLAILFGTIAGGIFISLDKPGLYLLSSTLFIAALLGWWMSTRIPSAKPTAPQLNINWEPITATWRNIQFSREKRSVFLSILGNSWFWLVGAVLLTQLPEFTHVIIGGDEHVVTILLAVLSIGIGVGSLSCERLSKGVVEIGLVPIGAFGISVFTFLLWHTSHGLVDGNTVNAARYLSTPLYWPITVYFFLIGFSGGVYIVPLFAFIQQRSTVEYRSRIMATNSIFSALFMVVGALFSALLLSFDFTIPQLMLMLAIFNMLIASYIFTLAPEFILRFLVWVIVNALYRIRSINIDNIPEKGPAVLVCNHVSFIDALIIIACCSRPVRFVMDHRIFNKPFLGAIFRLGKMIPIASKKDNPELLEQAFVEIKKTLARGELVVIFPEGKITHDGEISTFKPGIERIAKENAVSVIPMALCNFWGIFFSRKNGKAMSAMPRRFRTTLCLHVGEPIPSTQVNAKMLRQIVFDLRGERR